MATSPVGGRGDAKALLEEMKRRLERGPHAALGIVEGANPQSARAAFLELTKTYHPAKFAREPAEVVRQANEVFLSLRAAYDALGPARRPAPAAAGTVRRPNDDTPSRDAPPVVKNAPTHLQPAGTARRPNDMTPGMAARRPNDDTPNRGEPAKKRTPTPMHGLGAPIAPAPPRTTSANAPTPQLQHPRLKTPTPAPPTAPQAPQAPLSQSQRIALTPAMQSQRLPVTPPSQPPTTGKPGSASMAPLAADDDGRPSEETQLATAMAMLRRKQWTEARKLLHALAARVPVEKRYRALLAYARGREAQDGGRHDEARIEFTRALALDPELAIAKTALAQVAVEPERPPTGGLFSKLFKK